MLTYIEGGLLRIFLLPTALSGLLSAISTSHFTASVAIQVGTSSRRCLLWLNLLALGIIPHFIRNATLGFLFVALAFLSLRLLLALIHFLPYNPTFPKLLIEIREILISSIISGI